MELLAVPMAQSGGGGSALTLLLPLVLIVGMIWFMSRTQRKQRDRQAQMVSSLAPGAKVITTSGMVGIVEEVDDEYVTLEISDGVLIQVVKQAVGRVLPDETADDTEPAAIDESTDSAEPAEDDERKQDKPSLPPTHTEK